MSNQASDPVIRQYREQISDTDLKILEALNKRLRLVLALRSYKESKGIAFFDPEQENWVITYLTRSNQGPLSDEGLRAIYVGMLDVIKREAVQSED
jgi:chorismate mutase/prephenate dehydratase